MPLGKQELASFREQLEALISELEASLAGDGSTDTVQLDQTKVGRLSRMDALQAQQMALATERRNRQRLKAARNALQRIEDGDFGECLECEEDINPKRLAFDPTVAFCIRCADR